MQGSGQINSQENSRSPPPSMLSDDSYLLSLTGLSWEKITRAGCFKHWESLEEDAGLGSV